MFSPALFFWMGGSTWADESSPKKEPGGNHKKTSNAPMHPLPVAFSDDFQTDRRSNYDEKIGDVQWQAGQLTLAPRSGVGKRFEAGAIGVLTADLRFSPLAGDDVTSETHVGFFLSPDRQAMVIFVREKKSAKTNFLLAIAKRKGTENPEVVRRFQVTSLPDGEWTLRYNHGVVSAEYGGKVWAVADVQFNDLKIDGIWLAQPEGQTSLTQLSVAAAARPPAPSKEELKKKLLLKAEFDEVHKEEKRLLAEREFAKAIPIMRKKAQLSKAIYGEDSAVTLSSLSLLGTILQREGHVDEAKEQFLALLSVQRRNLGERHPDIGSLYNQLSRCEDKLQRPAEARDYARRAFDILLEIRGGTDRQVVLAGLTLAKTHHKLQDFEEAKKCAKLILRFSQEASSQDDLTKALASTALELGSLLQSKGDSKGAEPLLLHATRVYERIEGKESLSYFRCLWTLGMVYHATSDFVKEKEYWSQAASAAPKIKEVGEGSSFHIQCLNNVAVSCMSLKDYKEAARIYSQVLEIRQKKLGAQHRECAETLDSLALVHHLMSDFDKAKECLHQAVAIERKALPANDPALGWSLCRLGEACRCLHQCQEATSIVREAIDILGSLKNGDVRYEIALGTMVSVYTDLGDLRKAKDFSIQAAEAIRARQGQNDPRRAMEIDRLAGLCNSLHEYEEAQKHFQEVLEIRDKTVGKDSVEYAECLEQIAFCCSLLGKGAEARKVLLQALDIKKRKLTEGHPSYASTLDRFGKLQLKLGDFVQAEASLSQAKEIRQKALGEDHPDFADSLESMGSFYKEIGENAKAKANYRRALEIKKKTLGEENVRYLGSSEVFAAICNSLGDFEEAEEILNKIVAIRLRVNGAEHYLYADCLEVLAGTYRYMGQFERAEKLLEQTLALREKLFGRSNEKYGQTLWGLGQVLYRSADYKKAKECYLQYIAILKDHGGDRNWIYPIVLLNAGHICKELGELPQAETFLTSALEIERKTLGADHPSCASPLHQLAALYWTSARWQKGMETTDQMLKIYRGHVRRVLPGLSESEQLQFLANIFEQEFASSLSKAYLFGGRQPLIERTAEWLINGKALTAQALYEQNLVSRDFKDPSLTELARQLRSIRTQLANLTFQPWQTAADRDQRAPRLKELAEDEKTLSKRLFQMAGYHDSTDPWVALSRVREALPGDSILVEIARIDDRNLLEVAHQLPHYAAWIIPSQGKGDIHLVDLGDAEKIEDAVWAARQVLQEPNSAGEKTRKSLEDLSKIVLHPLLEHIGGYERWIISPDADLWLVPWSALPLPDTKFSVEKYKISYLVSGRNLLNPGYQTQPGPALVIADPDYDMGLPEVKTETERLLASRGLMANRAGSLGQTRFPRLPGTAKEAEAITPTLKTYTGKKPDVFTDKQALEGVFKMVKSPRVVVLSTHGFFLEDQGDALAPAAPARDGRGGLDWFDVIEPPRPRRKPGAATKIYENPLLRCGLVFTGANNRAKAQDLSTDDGILTGLEIVGTDLRGTELVVLSACQTGVGQVHNGEGVSGLRQAFQLAGARTVVATLWKIPDRETAELMTAFFNNLAAKSGKADALRDAQLAMIDTRRANGQSDHPYYWAAFTLTGQWK